MTLEWIFDPVPASGARLGGDPSAFVFEAQLPSFVREVLQNSSDQHRGDNDDPVEVDFVLDRLEGDRLTAFRDVFRWDALQQHVEAVLDSGNQTEKQRFQRARDDSDDELLVLWVVDRNTTGLQGDEAGGEGSFAALCRDRLFSQKLNRESGGSFGLGKAVLWRFSRWSTVLFYSRPSNEPDRPRLIAKAALPWHQDEAGDQWAGDGWLGRPEGEPPLRRAVSLRGAPATSTFERLGGRQLHDGHTGTAIGVIGFEEPSRDEPVTLEELAADLWRATLRSFWPALARDGLRVSVHVGPERYDPPPDRSPWAAMYDRYRQGTEVAVLEEVGDVVVHPVRLALPTPRRQGRGELEVTVDLVVRFADEKEGELHHVVAFRGAGMVVKRLVHDRLSAAARPFHALLVCGRARRETTELDDHVEHFLRDAEPPSHDDWTSTPRLKQRWHRGYAKAVRSLWDEARDTLRRIVTAHTAAAEEGPDALRRLFPLATGGGTGRPESAFHFRDLAAELDGDGRWHFSGRVAPEIVPQEGWTVRVDARVPEEGGKGVGALIADIEADPGTAELDDTGCAIIRAPSGLDEVEFRGRTEPSRFPMDPRRTGFELVVTGQGGVD